MLIQMLIYPSAECDMVETQRGIGSCKEFIGENFDAVDKQGLFSRSMMRT